MSAQSGFYPQQNMTGLIDEPAANNGQEFFDENSQSRVNEAVGAQMQAGHLPQQAPVGLRPEDYDFEDPAVVAEEERLKGLENAPSVPTAPAPQPAAPQGQPAQPGAPEIPNDVFEIGRQIGLSDVDVRQFGEAAIMRLSRNQLLKQNEALRQAGQAGGSDEPKGPAAPDLGFLTVRQDGDVVDEQLVAMTQGLRGQFDSIHTNNVAVTGEMQKLAESFELLRNELGARTQADAVRDFDEWVGGLKGWEDILGQGPTASLPRGTAPREAREQLWEQSRRLGSTYQSGEQAPPHRTLWNQSLYATFPDQLQRVARTNFHKQLRSQQGQFIAPASAAPSTAQGLPEGNRATSAVQELLNQMAQR